MSKRKAPVLGIDAAWTPSGTSALAFLVPGRRRWRCVHLASFVAASCAPEDSPAVRSVLRSTEGPPAVVAIDIPLSRKHITGRRAADRCVSREYGKRHCSTHSPTRTRPGRVSSKALAGWVGAGYALVTNRFLTNRAVLEVYPHTALLSLLRCNERFKYKVAKAARFWPGHRLSRIRRVVAAFKVILTALRRDIDGIDISLPEPRAARIRDLKEIEDQIDALVCAWTAIQYVNFRAVALGNDDAVIWVPVDSLRPDVDRGECLTCDPREAAASRRSARLSLTTSPA